MVIGAWRRRRDALFGPFLGYAVLLFAFSALVSAVHVPGRHVHPLGGGARAAGLRARPRGDRRRDRVDRRAAPRLGRDLGRPGVRRRRRRRSGSLDGRRRRADGPPALGRQARRTCGPSPSALDAAGAPDDRSRDVDRRRPAIATGPAIRAWCSSTTRSTPSSRSPGRTASAGWSSSRRTACQAVRDDPRRRPAPGVGRARRSSRPTASPSTRSASTPATPAAQSAHRREPSDEPPRGAGSRRSASSASRSPSASSAASLDHRLPQARGHRVLRRRRAQPRGGPRASSSDALWSYGTPPLVFPRPAFEVWLPLPSLLAAIPMALLGGDRADPARDVAMRASPGRVRGGRRRWSRSSPGGSRRTSPLERGAADGRGPDAGRRDRADRRPSTCRSSSTPPCPTRRCCSARSRSARRC